MKRRRFDATSGLDLFLDAICNTFGGIVFISMLVVILINSTSISSVNVREEATLQNQKHLKKLMQEKAKLFEEMQQQEEATKILGDSSEVSKLLAKARVERIAATRLEQELANLKKQSAKNKAKSDDASAQQELAAVRKKELESLENKLQREIVKRTKQLTLPTERNTMLVEQSFFMYNGRLMKCRPENYREFTDGVLPKPDVGIRVSKANVSSIQTQFSKHDSEKQYIAVALWEDSFSQWPLVQAAIRREGFSYRLLLLQNNEKISFGKSDGKVQQ